MRSYLVATVLLAGAVPQARSRSISTAFAFSGQLKQNIMRTRTSAKNSLCMMADHKIKVFLVRHGAVDLNSPGMVYPKDCFYGGQNVPLSELGKVEAQVLVNSYECVNVAAPIHANQPMSGFDLCRRQQIFSRTSASTWSFRVLSLEHCTVPRGSLPITA